MINSLKKFHKINHIPMVIAQVDTIGQVYVGDNHVQFRAVIEVNAAPSQRKEELDELEYYVVKGVVVSNVELVLSDKGKVVGHHHLVSDRNSPKSKKDTVFII